MASSWGTNAKIFECHMRLIPCMRFRQSLKHKLEGGKLQITLVNVFVQQWQSFSMQLHQTAPKSKGRGDCYYANRKESSPAWKIMLVLSRMELTPSIFKGPNLVWLGKSVSFYFLQQKKYCRPSSTMKKEKKLNQTFSPVWVTFHAALNIEMRTEMITASFLPWPRR